MDYDKLLNYLERKTADKHELQAASAIIGLRQRVQELEKQRDDFKRDAAEFSSQVSRLVDHNNNLVNHREELILEITRIKRGDFSNERIENASLKLCINVQNEQIEKLTAERDKATQYWQIAEGRCDALKQQRDELLAAAEAIEIDAEECLDFDECTAMLVSIDAYHKLIEAIDSINEK